MCSHVEVVFLCCVCVFGCFCVSEFYLLSWVEVYLCESCVNQCKYQGMMFLKAACCWPVSDAG